MAKTHLRIVVALVCSGATSARHAAARDVAARDLDVILYGAYGCVGHLTASHLASLDSLTWAVAGRNETKLQALKETLFGPSSSPEIIVSELGDTADLSWVARAKAVATAAGPFSVNEGESLLEACAAAGTHYADTSDEFYWQRQMIDAYDDAATASGARVVLAGGFCVVAGDLGAQEALDAARADAGAARSDAGAPASVDAWLEGYSGGLSAGVINTPTNASYPPAWETDP